MDMSGQLHVSTIYVEGKSLCPLDRRLAVPHSPVIFNLGYAYPRGYAKTSYRVCKIKNISYLI
jgi:hypothetical protein